MYDYYYGPEAEQFAFYRIPKILFEAEGVKDISTDAKLLYGLMLDRMQLSVKNQWFDEQGRVFIYFTVNQIMKEMGCASQKAVKLLDELEDEAGLIEREKKGFNKPNRIYVKNFLSVLRKSKHCDFENQNTEVSKITTMEFRKSKPNNTDINNTEYSDNNRILSVRMATSEETEEHEKQDRCDGMDEYRAYESFVKRQIEYDSFLQDKRYRADDVEEIVNLIVDVMTTKKGTIRISGDDKPVEVVKSRFAKLNQFHIEYVLDCMKNSPVDIRNIRAYMLAALYNAPTTISNYYTAMVNHDMANGLI